MNVTYLIIASTSRFTASQLRSNSLTLHVYTHQHQHQNSKSSTRVTRYNIM